MAIKGYHTGNGIFNGSEFMENLLNNQKNMRFSGAGASHQNGSKDCAINTVVTMERNVLMHAALICSEDTFTTELWPTAMDYEVWIYNQIPDIKSSLTTIEICSRSKFKTLSENLSNCNVWGCPKYFLYPKFHNYGVKNSKWAPRSLRGVNMGLNNM